MAPRLRRCSTSSLVNQVCFQARELPCNCLPSQLSSTSQICCHTTVVATIYRPLAAKMSQYLLMQVGVPLWNRQAERVTPYSSPSSQTMARPAGRPVKMSCSWWLATRPGALMMSGHR